MNAFRNGPCITSPDRTAIEIFARGKGDQRIYRRAINGRDTGKWEALTDLDGTLVDNRSDLDCTADTTATHLVALGNSNGYLMHAVGSGTVFNQFQREPGYDSLELTPSVTRSRGSTSYDLGVVSSQGASYVSVMPSHTDSDVVPIEANAISSAADVLFAPNAGSLQVKYTAAFTRQNTIFALAGYELIPAPVGSGWLTTVTMAPPDSNATYQYSPTICYRPMDRTGSVPPRTIVVVAGGRLWRSYAASGELDFGAWQPLSDANVTSAPDCVGTFDGWLHVVALGPLGTVLHVQLDTLGGASVSDLGGY